MCQSTPRRGGGGIRSQVQVGGSQVQVRVGGSQVQVQVGGSQVQVQVGGSQDQVPGVPSLRLGGVPGLRSGGGVVLVSVKGKIFDTRCGLIHVQTGKNFFCWGTPPPSKGKKFWHQIWLDTCSDREKVFCQGTPPLVKGKIFDTRFGLIQVQTGKKKFCWGTLPPPSKGKNFWHQIWLDTCSDREKIFCWGTTPLVKGKFFDTRFGLIHVQTGEKFLCKGTPPPPSKGKNFWHQIWLDTCSDWGKIFCWGTPTPNSKDLLWLRGGRYASCVHAGGLSCVMGFLCGIHMHTNIFGFFLVWDFDGSPAQKSFTETTYENHDIPAQIPHDETLHINPTQRLNIGWGSLVLQEIKTAVISHFSLDKSHHIVLSFKNVKYLDL